MYIIILVLYSVSTLLCGVPGDSATPWISSGPVTILHPRGYLMALPALTAVAVAAQRLVASTAAYLIFYGLGPQGLYGLGINIIVLYSLAGGDLVYHELLHDSKYPK